MLAGGASRRFGGAPKGLADLAGRRVVDRVVEALRPVVSELVLVANVPSSEAVSWLAGTRTIADRHAGRGGLAGVDAALQLGNDVLAVAWDMPFVTPALLGSIREQAARTGAEICVPESESPFGIEPFCAYYAVAVSERLEAFLDAGGGPAHAFLERCRVHRIPIGELRRYGDPSVLFMSVNDQDDLDRARALAGSSR